MWVCIEVNLPTSSADVIDHWPTSPSPTGRVPHWNSWSVPLLCRWRSPFFFHSCGTHTRISHPPEKAVRKKKNWRKLSLFFFLAQSHIPGSTNSALCKNLTPPLKMRGLLLDPADGVRRQQPGAVARKISVNENPGTNNLAGNLSTHTRAALGQPPREQYRASKAAKQLGAF